MINKNFNNNAAMLQKNEEIKLIENWQNYLNEAHGLNQKDLDYVKNYIDKTDDKELKRILNYIVKSNVLV